MTDVTDDPQQRLDALYIRYGDELPARIEHVRTIWTAALEEPSNDAKFEEFDRITHNLAGSGATFGYAALSQSALVLDEYLVSVTEAGKPPSNEHRDHIETLLVRIEQAATSHTAAPMLSEPTVQSGSGEDGDRLIFLVEDESEQAQSMAMEIAHFGYRVKTFGGLYALDEAVAEQRPTAIVMDMMFSEGRSAGAETVARMRQQIDHDIPVIFISVRSDFEARLNAVRAGADAYFVKPVEITEVVERLDLLTGRTVPEPYRILVIEDDATMADYYKSVMEQAGMEIDMLIDPMKVM